MDSVDVDCKTDVPVFGIVRMVAAAAAVLKRPHASYRRIDPQCFAKRFLDISIPHRNRARLAP